MEEIVNNSEDSKFSDNIIWKYNETEKDDSSGDEETETDIHHTNGWKQGNSLVFHFVRKTCLKVKIQSSYFDGHK